MKIGGLQKITLIDYPQKLSAIIFTSTCPFRCFFCYNPELVLPEKIKDHPLISEKEIFDFLKQRKGLLQGVVITGGEPLMHKDIDLFIRKIKKLGYSIKLDTNGFNPGLLKKLINEKLIDYVAMDIKAPPEKYDKITCVKTNIKNIQKSIDILKSSCIDYEFRTTLIPGFLDKKDILKIARWIKGAKKYYLQNFKPGKTITGFEAKPFSDKELLSIFKAVSPFFDICELR
ncbi:MAG: anaerobic ribonucleoside-triphosphate reductase activating protein [Candidatus Pacebacteria bacterium]|nr:anaerobic ribonucleoside-triphosphate reductase activating protein [Candidatus Paceibacterota bacterium]